MQKIRKNRSENPAILKKRHDNNINNLNSVFITSQIASFNLKCTFMKFQQHIFIKVIICQYIRILLFCGIGAVCIHLYADIYTVLVSSMHVGGKRTVNGYQTIYVRLEKDETKGNWPPTVTYTIYTVCLLFK